MHSSLAVAALLALVAFATVAQALSSEQLAAPVHDAERIDAHNAAGSTWTAGASPRFAGKSLADAVRMMGSITGNVAGTKVLPETAYPGARAAFDVETNWPNCTMPVQDQGDCGSCWAFGTSEALASRACIAAGGDSTNGLDVQLSAQQLVSCAKGPLTMGCNGGVPAAAWAFTASHPVRTDKCYPYTSGTTQENGKCAKGCPGSADKMTVSTQLFSQRTYGGPMQMQKALANDGAITGTFTVYKSFLAYKKGVYARGDDDVELGGHAILITGWGVQQNKDGTSTKYWRCKNSWGESWGEDGYFRIVRGDNDQSGGMDEGAVAGQVV